MRVVVCRKAGKNEGCIYARGRGLVVFEEASDWREASVEDEGGACWVKNRGGL